MVYIQKAFTKKRSLIIPLCGLKLMVVVLKEIYTLAKSNMLQRVKNDFSFNGDLNCSGKLYTMWYRVCHPKFAFIVLGSGSEHFLNSVPFESLMKVMNMPLRKMHTYT